MKTFDIRRFGKTLAWTFDNAKSELLRLGIIMTVIFYLVQEMMLKNIDITGVAADHKLTMAQLAIYSSSLFIYIVYMVFSASHMFACTKTKAAAINYLMFPASMLEKYFSRWIYVTIGMGIVGALSFVAADCLRALRHFVMDGPYCSTFVGALIESLSQEDWSSFPVELDVDIVNRVAIVALTMIWCHSFYILGSAFFRRHPLPFTIILHSLVGTFWGMASWVNFDIDGTSLGRDGGAGVSDIVILILLIAVNYVASYKLFERTNVINNKWINI